MNTGDDAVIRCAIEVDPLGLAVTVTHSADHSWDDIRELCELVAAGDPVVKSVVR